MLEFSLRLELLLLILFSLSLFWLSNWFLIEFKSFIGDEEEEEGHVTEEEEEEEEEDVGV